MAKKHLHKRTAKGHTYESYRKSITYKGQQFRPEAKSKADWEARVAAWKKEVDSTFLASDPKLTVNQLAEIFKDDARTTKKPKTIEMREMILRLYVLPHIGHMKLRQVRSENVEKAYDAAKGVSASILEQTHKVTNRMFNFAIENELAITENPISKGLVKRVKGFIARARETTEQDDIGLGLEEIDYILMDVKAKPHEIIFHLQILHGLRIAEALGLRWEDVDLERNELKITSQVSEVPKYKLEGTKWAEQTGPVITTPKTARSRRTVPLQLGTKALLEETPFEERHGYIYSTASGTPVLQSNYRRRVFNPLKKRLGLNTMMTHDLRKFFGSYLLTQEGVDVMTVSKWMGHANPAITMRIYAKVIPETEQQHRFLIGGALLR